jgi:hypothetical protein
VAQRRRTPAWIGVPVLVAGLLLAPTATAAAAPGPVTRTITAAGTASFASAGVTGSGDFVGLEANPAVGPKGGEIAGGQEADGGAASPDSTIVDRSFSRRGGRGGQDGGRGETKDSPELKASFDGLNHRAQRTANGGNQFSLEPPDQGLCAGNGFVMESVNDALAVYDQAGNVRKAVTDLNTFYGYPAAIDRTTGVRGQFVTDPSCLFDAASQRWFQVVLTLDVVPATGAFTGRNTIDIAVSRTASPLGDWTIYRLPVTDDGTEGTPNHACAPGDGSQSHPTACIGDYPHIGADANGFYVTTNEYPFFGPGFHAAQVYAFSKAALAASAPTLTVSQIDTIGADAGRPGFTLIPAISPGKKFENSGQGTEYLMSSNAAEEARGTATTSTDLLVWALTNTRSLATANPAVTLAHTTLQVGPYAPPPRADQKAGDFPLGQCLNDPTCAPTILGGPAPFTEVESTLDASDTRMGQVAFADGKLWAGLDTALTLGGVNKAGIEYFVVTPQANGNGVRGRVEASGYVGVRNNNVTYPAVGVTEDGRGIMAFTLVGADHYPSAAYTTIDVRGVGSVHVAAEGKGPQDGFSGYRAFNDPPRPRWGDYGAAAVDGSSVWIASEYIGQTCTLAQYRAAPIGSCGATRTALANWGTRISRLQL